MPPPLDPHRPVVTLTTDFGTADGYAGALKGRLAALAPEARLVDISHEISPQQVLQGAWCLRRAAREFPPGTVHLAVVDPGVGSGRAALVLETERFLLVGPDNGLLSLAARDDGLRRIFHISDNPPHWERSPGFDGLTLFAPVAASLATGNDPASLGRPAGGLVELPQPEPVYGAGEIRGEVLFFDRFGNAITNITRRHLGDRQLKTVKVGERATARPATHYAALAGHPGRIAALWNSDGHLELALFGRGLAGETNISAGEPVRAVLTG